MLVERAVAFETDALLHGPVLADGDRALQMLPQVMKRARSGNLIRISQQMQVLR
ncbi:hypothetical protein [Lysobacter sp. TY2-98]|uniref:hypothetical protein n=1 Tax=Lysobacter sp. TY2-98 TaxID=2290922 RepID=UPI0013B3AFCD|nr:hypothetical protein [Lysobacter sp. TY2-98]